MLTAALLFTVVPLVAWAASPATSRAVPHEIAFRLQGNLIVLEAEINGRSKQFILDTGAAQSVLGQAAANELSLRHVERTAGWGAGGEVEMSIVAINSLAIAGEVERDLVWAVMDLSGINERIGGGVDGVIGFDVLSRFCWTIDYAARRLTLTRSEVQRAAAIQISGRHATLARWGLTVEKPGDEWDFVTETPLPHMLMISQRGGDGVVRIQWQEVHGISLETLLPEIEKSLALQFEGLTILSRRAGKVAGHPASVLDCAGRRDGRACRLRLFALKPGDGLCTIKCEAPADTFDALAKRFDEIAASMRLVSR